MTNRAAKVVASAGTCERRTRVYIEGTDPRKPHETSFKQRNQKLPLFPSHHAIKAALPLLQVLPFILEGFAHVGELLPATCLLPMDKFAEYERHTRLQIGLP